MQKVRIDKNACARYNVVDDSTKKESKAVIQRFEEFTKNISLASKCIAKIKAHEMKRFGLGSGNVMCLFFLGQNPHGLTPAELCELCGEDKAGISRSLSTLREKGYVEVCDNGKKYRARYGITDEGKAVYETINNAIVRAVSTAGGTLCDDEREVFYRTFATIIEKLTSLCEEIGAEE